MPHTAAHRKPLLRWIVIAGLLLALPISHYAGRWARNRALMELNRIAADHVEIHLTYLHSQLDNLRTRTQLLGTDERVQAYFRDPEDGQSLVAVNHYLEQVLIATDTIGYILNGIGKVVAAGNWRAPDAMLGADLSGRPYFAESLSGRPSHDVAVDSASKRLEYHFSIPIRLGGRIVGVAVFKTDPNKFILPRNPTDAPFFVTEENGIAFISSSERLLFCHLQPITVAGTGQIPQGRGVFQADIKPLTRRKVERINGVRLITPAVPLSQYASAAEGQYILAQAPIPATGWTAFTLWPVHDLNYTHMQGLIITLLAIVAILLFTLFAVERWRHIKQIHEQAIRDPLTRLYTRLYMLESAGLLLAAHDRHRIPGVSAVMLDLDHFKDINDRFGHSAGDSVLVAAANVVHQECRDTDIPIRYGGEEILIFIPTGDSQQVLQLAERIRRQVKQLRIYLDNRQVDLTISGGIATHMLGEPLEKLIDRADRMLYKAKKNGRDKIWWQAGY